MAKSIKSASDRCAGRRFGVGQLSGSERDRDIELLKITVDFVSRKIFQESKRRIETKTGFSAPDSAELIARGSEATIIRSFLDFYLMRRFKVNFSRVLFRIWIFWVILILVKIFFSF